MKEKQKKRKILIGKIPLFVAKLTGFGHTDVVMDGSHAVHIGNDHRKELKALGISPTMFVQIVVDNFNTLYLGNVENGKQSYVLVVYDVPMSKAAAITMEYHPDGCYWLVRTAFPIRAAEIRNHPEKIIWTKEPTLRQGG